jgi:hypothetical protein
MVDLTNTALEHVVGGAGPVDPIAAVMSKIRRENMTARELWTVADYLKKGLKWVRRGRVQYHLAELEREVVAEQGPEALAQWDKVYGYRLRKD